jgi:hypothetical protein
MISMGQLTQFAAIYSEFRPADAMVANKPMVMRSGT